MPAQIRTDLQRRYIRLHLGDLLPETFALFDQLLDEPPEYKGSWQVNLHLTDEKDEGGLMRKQITDLKWYLHYFPALKQRLTEKGVDVQRHLKLLEMSQRIYEGGFSATLQLFRHFDVELPGFNFSQRMIPDRCRLRLVRYDARTDNEPQATGHVDYSAGTAHIGEYPNCRGLRIYENEKPVIYEPRQGHVMTFAGAETHILTNGVIPALGHDVRTEWTGVRYAAVLFMGIDCGYSRQDVKKLGHTLSSHYQKLSRS